jgi:hypothetical protein
MPGANSGGRLFDASSSLSELSGERHACRVSATEQSLQMKIRRILDDHERWEALGIGVNTGRARPDGSGVLIGINPGDLFEARLLLEEAYGPVIDVERAGPVVAV